MGSVSRRPCMSGPELDADEYLLYEVIHQYQQQGQKLAKTLFNKLAYIAKKELDAEGVDVDLPVYWYEHGMVVDLDAVSDDFFTFQDTSYSTGPGYNTVLTKNLDSAAFRVEDDKRRAIQRVVRETTDRYKDVYDTSVAKDETYDKYADNDFIINLNQFRYLLDDLEEVDRVPADEYAATDVSIRDILTFEHHDQQQVTTDIDDDELLESLSTLVATFPEDEYPHMREEFYEWESITRQLIYNRMFSQLDTFTSAFWNAFSKAELRIKHNEDISRGKLMRWRQNRDEYIEEFQDQLANYRQVLLENREETHVLDSVSEEFDEAVENAFQDFREQRQ